MISCAEVKGRRGGATRVEVGKRASGVYQSSNVEWVWPERDLRGKSENGETARKARERSQSEREEEAWEQRARRDPDGGGQMVQCRTDGAVQHTRESWDVWNAVHQSEEEAWWHRRRARKETQKDGEQKTESLKPECARKTEKGRGRSTRTAERVGRGALRKDGLWHEENYCSHSTGERQEDRMSGISDTPEKQRAAETSH
jgi:hypothetical protein